MFTAVSKPNVVIVPLTSLSIVFGTPTIFTPFSNSRCAIASDPSPPIVRIASIPSSLARSISSSERSTSTIDAVGLPLRKVKRISAIGRAEDGAAEMADAAHRPRG